METWPAELSFKPLAAIYDEQTPRIAIRTPMDSGPAKVRRKLSNTSRFINIELVLSEGEVEIFDAFVMDTLLGGTLRFEWIHPRTLATIESRIVVDESQGPKYRNEHGVYWVNFTLEILPGIFYESS